MIVRRRRQKLAVALVTLSLALSATVLSDAIATGNPMFKTKIDMNAPITMKQADAIVPHLDSDQMNLRLLLRQLGNFAGINIILDDTVSGTVSLSLGDVSVREALEYLRNVAGLYYLNKGDNILLVTTKEAAEEKGLTKVVSKMIPIKYVNAKLVAALLNSTLYNTSSQSAGAENASKKATAEFRTNSIILVGNDNDIRLAEDMIEKIDIPRESKSFTINHASPVEVAQLLQATIFNDGISPFNGGGGSGQASGGIPADSSSISVNVETYEEGSGSAEVQGASGEGGGGQSQTFTLRTRNLATKELKIAPDGPMIIPDTRTSTLTIMGTVEQIALAEAVIPTLDQKLPQVAIETSLVELFEDSLREARLLYGSGSGQFGLGFNNSPIPAIPTAGRPAANALNLLYPIIGIPTTTDPGNQGFAFNWTTIPMNRKDDFVVQIDSIISKNKGKLLANPTVIAIHNSEAIISITEEVIRTTQVTRDQTGFTQTQVEIGEAGIILNILPKVTGDGYVVLRIRPSVSTIAQVVNLGDNQVTLLDRRDLAVQEVRVADGQTLALGGLIQERRLSGSARVPGLGDLPLIGALFRASSNESQRTELVTLVTPRVLEDANPLNPARISSLMNKPEFKAMMERTNAKLNK